MFVVASIGKACNRSDAGGFVMQLGCRLLSAHTRFPVAGFRTINRLQVYNIHEAIELEVEVLWVGHH